MPAWLEPHVLELSLNWQFFPDSFTVETFFRVFQVGIEVPSGSLLLGVSYGDGGFYAIERLTLANNEPRLMFLPYPRELYQLGFRSRTLAIRYLGFKNLPSTPWTVTLTALEGDVNAMPLFSASPSPQPANSTAMTVEKDATTASQVLLPANPNRLGATLQNTSNDILYIDFDDQASLTSYAVAIGAGSYFEVPNGFVGAISGIFKKANGKALIREFISS